MVQPIGELLLVSALLVEGYIPDIMHRVTGDPPVEHAVGMSGGLQLQMDYAFFHLSVNTFIRKQSLLVNRQILLLLQALGV